MSKEIPIKPKHFYSLGEIVREGLIPGIDTIPKASNLVKTDLLTNKILEAVRIARGAKGVQYQVRGSNIIKFLTNLDDEKRIK